MGKCDNCKNNCCGNNFIGMANAYKHSNGDLFNQILLSDDELEDILENFGDEYIEYIEGMPFIALNKDRSCKAFKNGRCSIYHSRPDVCKLYPYYFDPFGGVFVDKNCPGFDEEQFDKKDVFDLVNKRIKLFASIEGRLHDDERFGKKIVKNISKQDLLNIVKKHDFLQIKDNMLHIENKNCMELAEKYGTPIAIAFVDIISRRIKELKATFAKKIRKYKFKGKYNYAYATKANYFAEVVYTSQKDAEMLEFSSEYDIDLLFQLIKLKKFDFNVSIICNGLKNESYLLKIAKLAKMGVKLKVIINNEEEYELLKKHKIQNIEIGLRYDCEREARLYKKNFDNFDIDENRFGVDRLHYDDMLEQIKQDGIYDCTVFYFNLGGEIKNINNYLIAFEQVCKFYVELQTKYPNLKYFDFGEGFPSRINVKFDIDALVDGMVEVLAKYAMSSNTKFDIIGENGRYTTEEHGVYLFKVEQMHTSYNKTWCVLNNSLLSYLPDIWRLNEDFILLPLNHWDKEFETYYLGGKSSDEWDKFFVNNRNKQILLPKTDEDLYFAVLGIGAYQEMISGDSCFSHCMIPKEDELVITQGKEIYIKSQIPLVQKFKRLSYTNKYLNNFK